MSDELLLISSWAGFVPVTLQAAAVSVMRRGWQSALSGSSFLVSPGYDGQSSLLHKRDRTLHSPLTLWLPPPLISKSKKENGIQSRDPCTWEYAPEVPRGLGRECVGIHAKTELVERKCWVVSENNWLLDRKARVRVRSVFSFWSWSCWQYWFCSVILRRSKKSYKKKDQGSFRNQSCDFGGILTVLACWGCPKTANNTVVLTKFLSCMRNTKVINDSTQHWAYGKAFLSSYVSMREN